MIIAYVNGRKVTAYYDADLKCWVGQIGRGASFLFSSPSDVLRFAALQD